MKFNKSRQRDSLLRLLQQTKTHPTADWLYEKLKPEFPNLSFGTVYRNLNILVEQRLIRKIPFGSTHDRYEGNINPHYHLICENCGLVQDFEIPLYKRINKQAAEKSGFKIESHRIDFFGWCKKCQRRKQSKQP